MKRLSTRKYWQESFFFLFFTCNKHNYVRSRSDSRTNDSHEPVLFSESETCSVNSVVEMNNSYESVPLLIDKEKLLVPMSQRHCIIIEYLLYVNKMKIIT